MPWFRKKPVVIEAVQYITNGTGASGYFDEMPDWLEAAYDDDTASNVRREGAEHTSLKIKTLEGDMYASQHDWVIRGVRRELYPCKPDIFAATYEAVDPPEAKRGRPRIGEVREKPWLTAKPPMSERTWYRRQKEGK